MLAHLLRPLTALAGAIVLWRAACDARHALVRLSQRELADIGLGAGDIEVASLLGRR